MHRLCCRQLFLACSTMRQWLADPWLCSRVTCCSLAGVVLHLALRPCAHTSAQLRDNGGYREEYFHELALERDGQGAAMLLMAVAAFFACAAVAEALQPLWLRVRKPLEWLRRE
eukprot:417396-Amphidinium_carterae.1